MTPVPADFGWHFGLHTPQRSATLYMFLVGVSSQIPVDSVSLAFVLAATGAIASGAQRGMWRDRRGLLPPPPGETRWIEGDGLTVVVFGPVWVGLKGAQDQWAELLALAARRLTSGEIVPKFERTESGVYDVVIAGWEGEA